MKPLLKKIAAAKPLRKTTITVCETVAKENEIAICEIVAKENVVHFDLISLFLILL